MTSVRSAPERLRRSLDCAAEWSAMHKWLAARPVVSDDAPYRYRAGALTDASSPETQLVIQRHADARGLPFGRHAASLVYQRYAHRLMGLAVASVLGGGVLPDLTADNVTVEFVDGSPETIYLHELRAIDDATEERFAQIVIDEHLLPMAQAWRSRGGVGLGNLLGNMAAGLARGVRIASAHVGTDVAREFGETVAACRPRLAGLGSYRVVSNGVKSGLFYDRKSCCHWYAVPQTGQFCSWCSRLTAEERTERFLRSLDDP